MISGSQWILYGGEELEIEGIRLQNWSGDQSRKAVASHLVKGLSKRAMISCLWINDLEVDSITRRTEGERMWVLLKQACNEMRQYDQDKVFNGYSRCSAASDLAAALSCCLPNLSKEQQSDAFRAWAKAVKSIVDNVWPGMSDNQFRSYQRMLWFWMDNHLAMVDCADEAESAAQEYVRLCRSRATAGRADDLQKQELARALYWHAWIATVPWRRSLDAGQKLDRELQRQWKDLALQLREADSILSQLPYNSSCLGLRCEIRSSWIVDESRFGDQARQVLEESMDVFRDSPKHLDKIRELADFLP